MSFKKHSLVPVWLCVIAFLLLLSTGCVISPRRTFGQGATPTPTPTPSATPTPTPGATATGKLYVTNSNANSILRFDHAFTASGNIVPAATIVGASTGLNIPAFITLDVANDRLFVTNSNNSSILIFDNISTKSGNAAPERTIVGASTSLVVPTDVSVDTVQDMLYVADDADVLVFATASTATGNAAPMNDIFINSIATNIGGIVIDASHDRLFVSDPGNNSIDVFDNASTLNGTITPNRVIQGALTHLAAPSSLQLDGLGRLVVSNSSNAAPSITIYANAATANGNVAPTGEIKGANTGFNFPDQIAVDPTGTGTVYNVDSGAARIAAFGNLSTANGNIAPTRSISGTSTGLTTAGRPEGLALDNTR
jgi:hypothetical protein